MKRGSTLVFPIVLLAFLAALTYWVNIKVQPAPPRPDGSLRHDPDYYLKNFITIKTDIEGKWRYRLKAKLMNHYPDDDTTDLVEPIFIQYINGKQYLQVKGLTGTVSGNGKDIKIYDDVLVIREKWGDKEKMTVETDFLHILPDEDLVLTQHPVVIRQPPETVIRAKGMVYEKAKERVTLLNRVKAHYVQPKKTGRKQIKTLEKQGQSHTVDTVNTLKNKAYQQKHLSGKQQKTE